MRLVCGSVRLVSPSLVNFVVGSCSLSFVVGQLIWCVCSVFGESCLNLVHFGQSHGQFGAVPFICLINWFFC